MLRKKRGPSYVADRDPVVRARVELAVRGLRQELLSSAAIYGTILSVTEGDLRQRQEWREWVDWMVALALRAGAVAGEWGWEGLEGHQDEVSKGPKSMLEFLDRTEEAEDAAESLSPDFLRAEWLDLLERLAGRARAVEEVGGEPLNEVDGHDTPFGLRLLDAVEQSLVLMVYGGGDERALHATSREIYDLMVAARAEGVWDFLDPEAASEAVAVTGKDSPQGMAEERAVELRDLLMWTWSETAIFYRGLRADGRELSEDEADASRERLRVGAACLRRIDLEREAIDSLAAKGRKDMDFGLTITLLRMMQRSLVLAISDEPARRAQTISMWRLDGTLLPVRAHWLQL
jgi:hypothetical protein